MLNFIEKYENEIEFYTGIILIASVFIAPAIHAYLK